MNTLAIFLKNVIEQQVSPSDDLSWLANATRCNHLLHNLLDRSNVKVQQRVSAAFLDELRVLHADRTAASKKRKHDKWLAHEASRVAAAAAVATAAAETAAAASTSDLGAEHTCSALNSELNGSNVGLVSPSAELSQHQNEDVSSNLGVVPH